MAAALLKSRRAVRLLRNPARYIVIFSIIFQLSLCAACSLAAFSGSVKAEDIWMAPNAQSLLQERDEDPSTHYYSLLKMKHDWRNALDRVSVFKLTQRVVVFSSNQDLAELFGYLRYHKKKVALEFGVLIPSEGCGRGVEGFFGRDLTDALHKIKRNGGEIDNLIMDEPLWYGYMICKMDMRVMYRQIGQAVSNLWSVFPHASVGEIEPVNGNPKWEAALRKWLYGFSRSVGVSLSVFHADYSWPDTNLIEALDRLKALVKKHDVRFGVIFNVDGGRNKGRVGPFDVKIADCVLTRISGVDTIVIQGWGRKYGKLLPDTVEGTMTNIISMYKSSTRHGIDSCN